MAIDLDGTIAWTTADADGQAMLSDLQGNILKGHGRRSTLNLFLRLSDDVATARVMMRRLGGLTISALDQLRSTETHKRAERTDLPTGATPTFFTVMLSQAGYERLDLEGLAPTAADDGAFRQGMRARAARLNDQNAVLDEEWKQRPDVLVLIGDDPDSDTSWRSSRVDDAETLVTSIAVAHGASIVSKQVGRAIFRTQPNGSTEGIEHFGYVDGRSQPLFLKESVDGEAGENWVPAFPLRQVLVADPGSAGGRGFGSFFVFRKLEQNVAAFKRAENRLKALLDRDGTPLGDVAGAMLVGRFEDGTPVTLDGISLEERSRIHTTNPDVPVPNDFDYGSDMEELRCPFHAHIRKTNPRGDTERLGIDTQANERRRIMARRGIPYGQRESVVDPSDNPDTAPQGGVGLLFMSYQSNIAEQFEFTQQGWANEPDFASGFAGRPAPGRDPIIGQRGEADPVTITVRHRWNDAVAMTSAESFSEHVTLKGGEYFFAPARSTLLSL